MYHSHAPMARLIRLAGICSSGVPDGAVEQRSTYARTGVGASAARHPFSPSREIGVERPTTWRWIKGGVELRSHLPMGPAHMDNRLSSHRPTLMFSNEGE